MGFVGTVPSTWSKIPAAPCVLSVIITVTLGASGGATTRLNTDGPSPSVYVNVFPLTVTVALPPAGFDRPHWPLVSTTVVALNAPVPAFHVYVPRSMPSRPVGSPDGPSCAMRYVPLAKNTRIAELSAI